jgi:tRNA threonylcarbamoyladenosine biosynthesis protein TsaE
VPPSAPNAIELVTGSAAATRGLAERLGAVAGPGDVVGLWGELGAGKTVFAKGFGAGLGVTATINSPSFILMAEYAGRLPLFHIDLYRLEGPAEALEGGLLEERQSSGVVVIEWPDRLGPAIPIPRLDIRFDGSGDEPRRLTIATIGAGLDRYLEVAAAAGDGR